VETSESQTVQREELLALGHRLAAMSGIRKVATVEFVAFPALAIYNNNWWLIPIALVAAFIAAWAMSVSSANTVQRLSGLSHNYRGVLWERYKTNPEFAAQVNPALQTPNALDR
jgi:hypothetical protein